MIGNQELSSKNGVGSSRRPRIAEWLIPKAATGKKRLEAGGRLEQGASLGLFRPNTVKARDRSAGQWSTLPGSHSFFFFFNLFYLFLFLAALGLRCSARASHCSGFSYCGARRAGFSSCGARAQPLRGMRNLPGPGLKLVSPALAGGFLTTALPGKPWTSFLTLPSCSPPPSNHPVPSAQPYKGLLNLFSPPPLHSPGLGHLLLVSESQWPLN